MKHRLLLAALLLGLCLPIPASVLHAAERIIDSRQQLAFAEHLFNQGQYRRAAEEYIRYTFFFPGDPDLDRVRLKAAEAHLLAGDGGSALQVLRPLTEREPLDAAAVDAYLLTAECHLQRNDPNQAVLQLNNLILLTDDPSVKDRAHLRIGWIHIEQLDWQGGRRALARITEPGRQRHQVDRIVSALDTADHLPGKNPSLAGALSILPGAGQLYVGRYQDALSAFLVNGGLFWAAYESFDNDLNVLGGLLTVVGIGFYTGNIYSAISSAHKYNRAVEEGFVDHLKHQVIWGSGLDDAHRRHTAGNGLRVRWQIPF
ncbi:tetratricopeptide repeat protein [Desulfatitalea alkaliphila]|uniref:Tetratricopeptide repeat protein n=1 Tax=Desulfatitalea alkaliphila TaxID=2929485 RepID=A0AA41R7V0_9BACT|nr:tetratricopeptide repeat protein [Desulfatitalea alkaliphila]MCJ8500588.1 tetratricopeptide repeat protein [Desulfatitalea alkaliphila]